MPHPGIPERPFVVHPLAEIAPRDLVLPGHGPLALLLSRCPQGDLRRLEPVPA